MQLMAIMLRTELGALRCAGELLRYPSYRQRAVRVGYRKHLLGRYCGAVNLYKSSEPKAKLRALQGAYFLMLCYLGLERLIPKYIIN
jgi:hypothetical protein